MLKVAKDYQLSPNLHTPDTTTGQTLFQKWQKEAALATLIGELDPQAVPGRAIQILFKEAVLEGKDQQAVNLLKKIEEESLPLSLEEAWIKRAFLGANSSFTDSEFLALDPALKQTIYRIANTFVHEALCQRLNRLGMEIAEGQLEPFSPRIISPTMDACRVKQTIQQFVANLRTNGQLLSRREFEKIELAYMRKADDIERILGRNHIEETARRLNLKHVKVPKKVAVVKEEQKSLSFTVKGKDMTMSAPEVSIYAERIRRYDRSISREEMQELIQLFIAAGYGDLNTENLIVAEEGVYIIDTEFKAFALPVLYEKFYRFKPLLDFTDYAWFDDFIGKKVNEQKERGESSSSSVGEKKSPLSLEDLGFIHRCKPFKVDVQL